MLSLIDSSLVRGVAQLYGHPNSLSLKEHDASAVLKELVVTSLPNDALMCDLDPIEGIGVGKKARLKRYSWFFSDSHVIARKQCDGALNVVVGGAEYLVLIELKSSLTLVSKARKQIQSGRAFAQHLVALIGRPIIICSRVIYIGPPVPVPVYRGPGVVRPDREIPVSAPSGRVYLSLSELLR